MSVAYTKDFIKHSKKLSPQVKQKLLKRIELFTRSPLDPILGNHSLTGKYKKYRSINVTGDIRALYIQEGNEEIFCLIGTHSQLYG